MVSLMRSELDEFAREIAGSARATAFAAEASGALPERLARLAELTGEPPGELAHAFGGRLFERFTRLYPEFMPARVPALDWLERVERHVHDELRDFYPEARPPRLCCVRVSADRLLIRYGSEAPVAEMFAGIIEAALARFEVRAELRRRETGAGFAVFEVTLLAAA